MVQKIQKFYRNLAKASTLGAIRYGLNTLALVSKPRAGKLAFELFSTPRRKKYFSHFQALMDQAQVHRITLNGRRIVSYEWPGNKPAVMLAHGWESSSARWAPLIEELRSRDFRVVAVDAPAHGESEGRRFNVRLYAEALEIAARKFQPQSLVGHSAGGMAAVYLLTHLDAPGIRRLSLLAAPSELTDLLENYRRTLGLSNLVIEGLYERFEKRYLRPVAYFSIKEFVRQLEIPGLIIHDRQDQITAFSDAEAIHQNWASSRLITTEGLGHSLNSPEVVQAVADFLEGIQSTPEKN
jgi:pimeloyl-ACP methyl ester carboxylesterase